MEHCNETDSFDSDRARDADRLEELVRDLEGRSGASALMREHLETARSYLLGSMPQEYSFNLKLAQHLLRLGHSTLGQPFGSPFLQNRLVRR